MAASQTGTPRKKTRENNGQSWSQSWKAYDEAFADAVMVHVDG